jgi:hypothetical protein
VLISLKFFSFHYRAIDYNPKIKLIDLNPDLLHTYLEIALNNCTLIKKSTSSMNNNENKYKRELALEILDKVVKHHLKQCDTLKFSQLLNQVLNSIFVTFHILNAFF